MAAEPDQERRGGDHEQEEQPAGEREVQALPDRRADSFGTARARVLSHERGDVARRSLEQGERQPEEHDRREGRGDLIRVVAREEDAIDGDLDRHEAHAEDERQRQHEQLPAAAGSRDLSG